ncbi:hypothetical protein AOLI_G00245750 [Acnodon oligacanthus]
MLRASKSGPFHKTLRCHSSQRAFVQRKAVIASPEINIFSERTNNLNLSPQFHVNLNKITRGKWSTASRSLALKRNRDPKKNERGSLGLGSNAYVRSSLPHRSLTSSRLPPPLWRTERQAKLVAEHWTQRNWVSSVGLLNATEVREDTEFPMK